MPGPAPYTKHHDAVLLYAQLGQAGGFRPRLLFSTWFGGELATSDPWPEIWEAKSYAHFWRAMEKVLALLGSVCGSPRVPPDIHCPTVGLHRSGCCHGLPTCAPLRTRPEFSASSDVATRASSLAGLIGDLLTVHLPSFFRTMSPGPVSILPL